MLTHAQFRYLYFRNDMTKPFRHNAHADTIATAKRLDKAVRHGRARRLNLMIKPNPVPVPGGYLQIDADKLAQIIGRDVREMRVDHSIESTTCIGKVGNFTITVAVSTEGGDNFYRGRVRGEHRCARVVSQGCCP